MSTLLKQTIKIDGLLMEISTGDMTATPDNPKFELHVGQGGAYTYVQREDAGKGSGTIMVLLNTVYSRRMEVLRESGNTTSMVSTKIFDDGSIETVVLDGVKIQNPTSIFTTSTTGSEESSKREYNFTFANYRVL